MNMINAKELRIGNLVKIPFGIGRIYELSSTNCWLIFNGRSFTESSQSYDSIYPIELTEDVIIKCGFQEVRGYIYLTHDALNLATLQYDKEKRVVWLEFEGTICGNEIQNLHQLQNLYFALTGEALNIELNAQGSDTTEAK